MIVLEHTLVLAALAVPVTYIDIRSRRIPDICTIGGLAALALLSAYRGMDPFLEFLVAAGLGLGVFLLVRIISGGKLGLGDVKYSGLIGGALGTGGWLVSIFFASTAALIFGLWAMISGRMEPEEKIPFAPFLTIGALSAVVFLLLTGGMF